MIPYSIPLIILFIKFICNLLISVIGEAYINPSQGNPYYTLPIPFVFYIKFYIFLHLFKIYNNEILLLISFNS